MMAFPAELSPIDHHIGMAVSLCMVGWMRDGRMSTVEIVHDGWSDVRRRDMLHIQLSTGSADRQVKTSLLLGE